MKSHWNKGASKLNWLQRLLKPDIFLEIYKLWIHKSWWCKSYGNGNAKCQIKECQTFTYSYYWEKVNNSKLRFRSLNISSSGQFLGSPNADIIELSNVLLKLKNQRLKNQSSFSIISILKLIMTFWSQSGHVFCWTKI